MDADIRPSLHAGCHHQIIHAKFNLKIHYLPPYEGGFGILILLEGR